MENDFHQNYENIPICPKAMTIKEKLPVIYHIIRNMERFCIS